MVIATINLDLMVVFTVDMKSTVLVVNSDLEWRMGHSRVAVTRGVV